VSNDLQDLLQDLISANGGAAQVAAGTIASGKLQAATGFRAIQIPGPALQEALARHTGSASGSATAQGPAVPAIADHIAAAGADQLVKLLMGSS
jgi:hypothetical protein